MAKSKMKRLPKYSTTTIIKFPTEKALNSFLLNEGIIALQGKIDAIAKREYNGEVNSLIQRELKDPTDAELQQKYKDETGKRPLYRNQPTTDFVEWKIIYKNRNFDS